MATAAVSVPRNEQPPAPAAEPNRRRKRGHEEDQQARYFLAKEGSSPEKPELGAEAANEGEALIKAFQTKSGLLYCRRGLQGGGGDPGRLSDIGEAARAQIAGPQVNGFKEDTTLKYGYCHPPLTPYRTRDEEFR